MEDCTQGWSANCSNAVCRSVAVTVLWASDSVPFALVAEGIEETFNWNLEWLQKVIVSNFWWKFEWMVYTWVKSLFVK